MKNVIHLFLFVFASQMVTAQLNVIGDNFIYSKGTDIFVKEEVNLEIADSKIFLRGEAQLMQESNVPNTGAGFISLFQEGTSNQFTYNYWSAPVSDQSTGANGNVGFKNTQIKYPTVDTSNASITTTDFTISNGTATILPVNVRNGVSDDANIGGSELQIAGRWLYTYDSGGNATTGYAGWSRFNGSSDIARSGYGFTMKGVREISGGSLNYDGGQRYDFRGRPNNGEILVGVGNDNSTLAGNPYPSALDLKRFLQVNSEHISGDDVIIDPWVEFWESQVETDHNLVSYLGGYARYIPLGYDETAGEYDNDGTYLEPIFRRTDNTGNIITSSAQLAGGGGPTGPPGDQTSFSATNIDGKRRFAAIGQGFFISRTNTDVPLTSSSFYQDATPDLTPGVIVPSGTGDYAIFNNSMRVFQRENTTTSIFKAAPGNSDPRSAVAARQIPKMIVNVVPDGLYVRPLKFIFSDNTSQGYDYGWESPVSGRVGTDAYIKIGTNGEYGLSSQAYDENMAIPLGVEVANTFTAPIDVEFEIAFMINFDPTNVYLHDIQTGVYHDIKSGNQTLLLAPGHYTDRFEITFKNNSGTLSNDSFEASNFDVVQNNRNKELTVFNPELLDVSNIALYDLAGRQIFSSQPAATESSYSFDTATLSNAIYIAKVTTVNGNEKSVKVSISN